MGEFCPATRRKRDSTKHAEIGAKVPVSLNAGDTQVGCGVSGACPDANTQKTLSGGITMKPQSLAALAALAFGLPALAVAQSSADANGDGVLTIEEVQAVLPDVDSDTFSAMDANGDGALDEAEIAVAQEAGLLPATDG